MILHSSSDWVRPKFDVGEIDFSRFSGCVGRQLLFREENRTD